MKSTTSSKQPKQKSATAAKSGSAPLKVHVVNTPGIVIADILANASAVHIVPYRAGATAVVQLIGQARAGVPVGVLRELSQRLELSVRELAPLLGSTERTLARRFRLGDALNKAESERLLLLQRLATHGVEVFEDQGKFNRWLRRPLPLLDHQPPLHLLDTVSGFQVVDELLGRIEYGVYS